MCESNNKTDICISDNFEECFDNLKHTRDFDLYIDTLSLLSNRSLLILSVKCRSGGGKSITNELISKIHALGFTKFKYNSILEYVGVINKGAVIFDEFSDKVESPPVFDGEVENIKLHVSSKAFSSGDIAEIIINSENYSLNEVGLNFVVYDCKMKKVVDSSCYNPTIANPTFYHRNLFCTVQYINSHFYTPSQYINDCARSIRRSYFSNRKLNVTEVDKGIILPNKHVDGKAYGGVCDQNFNFIAGHQIFGINPNLHSKAVSRHIYDSYSVSTNDIEYMDETVVYGGTMVNHPGHMIVECFADRIWWFVKNPEKKYKIAITTIWEKNIWSSELDFFVKEFLHAFGLENDRIVFVKKPMQFKKIIVPDQSSLPTGLFSPYEFTNEYIMPFKKIIDNISPANYKKIYLSKNQTAKKNIIGEDFFIDFFSKKGFKIINPEEYSVKEKAALMYGADEIVTLDGSNVVYSVFCKPSARVTALMKESNVWNSSEQLVIEATGIKEFYLVNVSANIFDRNFSDGLLLACVTDEFRKYVKYIYHEDIEISYEDSLKSVLYEYLAYVPEYFSSQKYFNIIKNQKMLTVLQNISEVFLGKDFDTSKLDLSTNETDLQKQVTDLALQKNNLTSQVSLLSAENTDLKASVDKLEEEKIEIISQREKNTELLESIQAEIKNLTAASEHFNSEKLLMKAEIELLHNEKNKLNDELLRVYKEKNEMYRKLTDLSEQETALKLSVSQHEYRADMLTSENVRINSSLSDANHHIEELEKERDILKSRITEMQSTRSWRYTRIFRKNKKDEEI